MSERTSRIVNIHEAKTQFSRLVDRAHGGERVVIGKAGVPVAILGPIESEQRKRVPGNDRVIIHSDFDDPVPEWDPDYMHPDDPMRELLK